MGGYWKNCSYSISFSRRRHEENFAICAIALTSLTIFAASSSAQQDKSARPSPPAKAECKLAGGKTITIDYSSPHMKGRKIFGELVPYGKVWRAGANEATTFVTTADLNVGGTAVPAGNYTIFVIPNADKWTLILVTSIKYVTFAMSIDNDGEGGILALMSLLGIKKHQRLAIVAVGLFGAALIYGDGAITPAISVLSALEGLNIATPALKAYVLPGAVAILIALFAIQPLGTSRIGKAFGPIMGLWFLSIAALGIWGSSGIRPCLLP